MPPLFSKQFEATHGRPMDFFLKGGSFSSTGNERHFFDTPEEHDAWIKTAFSPEMSKKLVGGASRDFEKIMSEKVDARSAIMAFRESPDYVTTGHPLRVARNILALDAEMRTNARPNNRTLYRGSARTPAEDAQNNMPISFSESKSAAGHFARMNRGEVFTAGHQTVRGIRMEDYGIEPKKVGPRAISEREWLIDPRSLRAE